MTNCTAKSFELSPLSRKKISAAFNGGSISSNAGIMLLREVDRHLSMRAQLKTVLLILGHQAIRITAMIHC